MKKVIIISVLSMIVFMSCKENNHKADAYGNFEATEVIVSSQAMGQILNFTPQEGDLLIENQVMGLVDTIDLVLKKKLLEQQKITIASQFSNVDSEIDVLNQQLHNAVVNQNRIHKLFDSGAATQKQVDDVDGMVDLIEKQISSAKTRLQNIADQIDGVDIQIDQVNESLSKCVITNPQAGTVLVKYSEQGEVAAPGKPLYKIADLTEMKLKAYVSGAQLPQIKLGQQVEVQFDKTKKENSSTVGIISWISSSSEFTPKTIQTKEERVNLVYAIKVTVKNDGTIKIGMPGEIYFTNN